MAVKKIKETYTCEFCGMEFNTVDRCEHHEISCDKNPKVKEAKRLQDQFQAKAEEIRLTSKTIPEVIERTIKLLDGNGIELTLISYPSVFNEKISNSHNSPIGYKQNWCGEHKDYPSALPGWRGQWKGTLKYKESHPSYGKDLSFDHLYDKWERHNISINYIHASGGSFGSKFDIGGMFWLYDFPLMYEEFQKNNGEFDILVQDYKEVSKNFIKEYTNLQDIYTHQQSDMVKLKDLQKKITVLLEDCNQMITLTRKFHDDVFKSTYSAEVPQMTSAFVNISDFTDMIDLLEVNNIVKPVDRISEISDRMTRMLNEYNEYINQHPDRFY